MVSDKKELGSIGNMQNIVFLKASGELVYINSEAKLINALKGDKTVIAENVKDGSLSLINNTKESITYIDNDGQYYLKTPSAKKVLMGNVQIQLIHLIQVFTERDCIIMVLIRHYILAI